MPGPGPTDTTRAARAVLNDTALPEVESHFAVPTTTVREIAALGADESLAVLDAPETAHAGWASLLSGASLARNSEELTPRPDAGAPDPSFVVGIAWSGLVVGAVGDELVRRVEAAPEPADWTPGEPARGVRTAARELVDAELGEGSSPAARRRFAEDAIGQLDAGILHLDHALAGWALCAVGTWAAARSPDITAPLRARRGLLRRAPKLPQAASGCRYAGALLSQTGLILLEPR